jgi:hypothetical protein
MGGVLAGTYVCEEKNKKAAETMFNDSPLNSAINRRQQTMTTSPLGNQALAAGNQALAANKRSQGLSGSQGIQGWRGAANYRQFKYTPGSRDYNKSSNVYRKQHFRGNAGGVVKHYPGPVAGDYFLRDDQLANPMPSPYVQGQPGELLTIDQQIRRIAERRAQGLDGRLPKYATVRDVSSDFNRPSDGRPSPYNMEVMANAVRRVQERETLNARTLESVQDTIAEAERVYAAMHPKDWYVGQGAPKFKPTADEYSKLF